MGKLKGYIQNLTLPPSDKTSVLLGETFFKTVFQWSQQVRSVKVSHTLSGVAWITIDSSIIMLPLPVHPW